MAKQIKRIFPLTPHGKVVGEFGSSTRTKFWHGGKEVIVDSGSKKDYIAYRREAGFLQRGGARGEMDSRLARKLQEELESAARRNQVFEVLREMNAKRVSAKPAQIKLTAAQKRELAKQRSRLAVMKKQK